MSFPLITSNIVIMASEEAQRLSTPPTAISTSAPASEPAPAPAASTSTSDPTSSSATVSSAAAPSSPTSSSAAQSPPPPPAAESPESTHKQATFTPKLTRKHFSANHIGHASRSARKCVARARGCAHRPTGEWRRPVVHDRRRCRRRDCRHSIYLTDHETLTEADAEDDKYYEHPPQNPAEKTNYPTPPPQFRSLRSFASLPDTDEGMKTARTMSLSRPSPSRPPSLCQRRRQSPLRPGLPCPTPPRRRRRDDHAIGPGRREDNDRCRAFATYLPHGMIPPSSNLRARIYAAPPPLQSAGGKCSLLQCFMPHHFGNYAHIESVSETLLVRKVSERVQ
ncbi:hypothetical protein EW146_g10255 [Bondarzewia mesenterica]|uniref:Uncharacterized protein n=1 Tax=Bondarzewia mesenterica TaxID=1095465 RepID=A0A4S4KYZ3_9AGAM|nr:hypothetical protein EW146_g10255 [Bondarzewia mesenterica]